MVWIYLLVKALQLLLGYCTNTKTFQFQTSRCFDMHQMQHMLPLTI